uniref:Peptidase S1 domain-containing protein n=1 Tax=Ditylenchus dipsaci TaxID=166011 RepID=A0A915DNR2_9BILA
MISAGSIVGSKWILTSVLMYPTDQYRIKIGVDDASQEHEVGETIHVVKAIHNHPKFHFEADYNICLIELAEDIKYTQHVQPICLAKDDSQVTKKTEPKAGWSAGLV